MALTLAALLHAQNNLYEPRGKDGERSQPADHRTIAGDRIAAPDFFHLIDGLFSYTLSVVVSAACHRLRERIGGRTRSRPRAKNATDGKEEAIRRTKRRYFIAPRQPFSSVLTKSPNKRLESCQDQSPPGLDKECSLLSNQRGLPPPAGHGNPSNRARNICTSLMQLLRRYRFSAIIFHSLRDSCRLTCVPCPRWRIAPRIAPRIARPIRVAAAWTRDVPNGENRRVVQDYRKDGSSGKNRRVEDDGSLRNRRYSYFLNSVTRSFRLSCPTRPQWRFSLSTCRQWRGWRKRSSNERCGGGNSTSSAMRSSGGTHTRRRRERGTAEDAYDEKK